MLEIIRDIIRYFAKWFHHTHCTSNCGVVGCDCDNEAESSLSSGSSTQVSHDDVYNHHRQGGAAISHTRSTHS